MKILHYFITSENSINRISENPLKYCKPYHHNV